MKLAWKKIPEEILLRFDKDFEEYLYYYTEFGFTPSGVYHDIMMGMGITSTVHNVLEELYREHSLHFNSFRNCQMQYAINAIYKHCKCSVTPILLNETEFERTFYAIDNDKFYATLKEVYKKLKFDKYFLEELITPSVNKVVDVGYKAVIDTLPIAIEDKLTWEQVEEIRKDKGSFRKLQRLRSWINNDFKNKSPNEIQDILSKQVEEYKKVLDKFSIEAIIGGFTAFVSSAGALLGAITGDKFVVAGATLTIGANAVSYFPGLAKNLVDIKKNPVAYYYNILKRDEK